MSLALDCPGCGGQVLSFTDLLVCTEPTCNWTQSTDVLVKSLIYDAKCDHGTNQGMPGPCPNEHSNNAPAEKPQQTVEQEQTSKPSQAQANDLQDVPLDLLDGIGEIAQQPGMPSRIQRMIRLAKGTLANAIIELGALAPDVIPNAFDHARNALFTTTVPGVPVNDIALVLSKVVSWAWKKAKSNVSKSMPTQDRKEMIREITRMFYEMLDLPEDTPLPTDKQLEKRGRSPLVPPSIKSMSFQVKEYKEGKDKRGYRYCTDDGKRVACRGAAPADPAKPAKPAAPASSAKPAKPSPAAKPANAPSADKPAPAKPKPGKVAAPKVDKQKVAKEAIDKAFSAAREIAKDPSKATAEQVKAVGDALLTLTLPEIRKLKAELKVTGGGVSKASNVEAIKKQALTGKAPAPAPKPVQQPPQTTPQKQSTGSSLSDLLKQKTVQSWVTGEQSNKPIIVTSELKNGGVQDDFMAELNKEMGFDKLPEVIEESDMDKFVQDGEVEIFRGLSGDNAREGIKQFKEGSFYAGIGVSGNGTYTAKAQKGNQTNYGYNTAKEYADGNEKNTIRMTLKKGSKIAKPEEVKDLLVEQEKILKELNNKHDEATTDKEKNKIKREMRLLSDPGRFIQLKGFDAFDVSNSNVAYVVVLNRGACRVQNTPPKQLTKKPPTTNTTPNDDSSWDDDDGIDL